MEDTGKKAKTHKGKLYLESRQPKEIETFKKCLFINNNKSSEITKMIVHDLFSIRKTQSKKLGRKNVIPDLFTDDKSPNSVEYLSEKNDTALFTYATDTKKRPMNLLLGSLFDNRMLDFFEFEVINYLPISYFTDIEVDACMKPIIIFQGDSFETDFELERVKKFFLDYLMLYEIDDVNISDLKRIIILSTGDDKVIKFRSFQVDKIDMNLIKDNKLDMKEIGPSLDLKLRRAKLASSELYKLACRQPKILRDNKPKNIETNNLGEKRGRIHVGRQDVNKIPLRPYKFDNEYKEKNKEKRLNKKTANSSKKEENDLDIKI